MTIIEFVLYSLFILISLIAHRVLDLEIEYSIFSMCCFMSLAICKLIERLDKKEKGEK